MSFGPQFISGLPESEPNTVMAEIEYVRKQESGHSGEQAVLI